MAERVALVTDDGETLDAELATADVPSAQVVLCHPHPQHGGSMRSLVISELFAGLPGAGVDCLRFDFRGVGASTGRFGDGVGERHDVRAALAYALARAGAVPTHLVGWSFGADLALSIRDAGHAGWVGIALPLHWLDEPDATGADPRPKRLLLAEHDEFRPPAEVREATAGWSDTEVDVIGGASHFFVGRTARLVERVRELVTPA